MTLWIQAALAGAPPPVAAPAAEEGTGIPGIPPGPPPPAEQVSARTQAIAKVLRCPVCQGLSVADSTSEAAVLFQRRIQDLVAQGYTEGQIKDYFIDRYGEWILLDPPAQGLDAVLWVVPGLAAGLGLAWAVRTATLWRREPDDVPLPSDLGLVPKDPYEAKLLAELEE